jgi:hypothetical protein
VESPDLNEGDCVEITVVRAEEPPVRHRTVLEVLDSLPGQRLFNTPEDVDRYLREERDSWDA